MPGNTFGSLFRLSTFGESHGFAIGGIIEGCPAGLKLNFNYIQEELDWRKPGNSPLASQRKEKDEVKFLSGIFEGVTIGTPIGFLIENKDVKSVDYNHLKGVYRPSHGDFTYDKKFGLRDPRGGGRSSARETASWVAAGAIAKQLLSEIKITAYVSSIEKLSLEKSYQELDLVEARNNLVRCPDQKLAGKMIALIEKTKKKGNSLGGVITCVIKNVPWGLGEPVFEKLHSALGKAMLSIPAVKGFEYGSGFEGTKKRGSTHNDLFIKGEKTKTNHSGGIQGGISNGMDIYFRVAFKPTSTIMQAQMSIDSKGKEKIIEGKGRHDPCVLPRAVPIVEAMSALTLADFWLLNKSSKL